MVRRFISILLVFCILLSFIAVSADEGSSFNVIKKFDINEREAVICVDNGLVYVLSSNLLEIYNKNGELVFTIGTDGAAIPASLSVSNDNLYFGCEKENMHKLFKYSLASGKPELVNIFNLKIAPGKVVSYNEYSYVSNSADGISVFEDGKSEPIGEITGIGEVKDLYLEDGFLYAVTKTEMLVYILNNKTAPQLFTVRAVEKAKELYQFDKNNSAIFLSDDTVGFVSVLDTTNIDGPIDINAPSEIIFTNEKEKIDITDVAAYGDYFFVANSEGISAYNTKNPSNIIECGNIKANAYQIVASDGLLYALDKKTVSIINADNLKGVKSILPYEFAKEINSTLKDNFFDDMGNHWAAENVRKLANSGIVDGDINNNFNPDNEITRAEFLAMLVRAVKLSPVDYYGCFNDIDGDEWYAKAFQIAYDKDLIDDSLVTDNCVFPDEPLKREDMAVIVINTLNKLGVAEFSECNSKFDDSENISAYALDYINTGVALNIFKGYSYNGYKFLPKKTATRAEAAEVVVRVAAIFDKADIEGFYQAPVIINISDAIEGGEACYVYGEGLSSEYTKIAVSRAISTDVSELPDENAIYTELSYVDADGNCGAFVMPKKADSGVYNVWVQNEYGWSKPCLLNAARTLYIAENGISPGIEMLVSGRNFDGREFGAPSKTNVQLVGDNGRFDVIINEVNPYAVKFTIDESVPEGDYRVFVTNDGVWWSEADTNQLLNVKHNINDPFELGVAWADEFNYDNIANVRDYGAKGDGATDDYEAIRNALDYLDKNGGGVLYLPEGDYLYTKTINLPGYIIIRGEGKDKSTLTYSSESEESAIYSDFDGTGKYGHQGFLDFKLRYDPNCDFSKCPMIFIWLGNDYLWGRADDNYDIRTADCLFFKGFAGETSQEYDPRKRFKGMLIFQARDHVLIDSCYLIGNEIGFTRSMMRNYLKVTNNIDHAYMTGLYLQSTFSWYENNEIVRDKEKFDSSIQTDSQQGLYVRAFSYVANNVIKYTGSFAVDGEAIAAEAYCSGSKMAGNVVAATENKVVIDPLINKNTGLPLYDNFGGYGGTEFLAWDITCKATGFWNIAIVEGKGLGQKRKITELDKNTKTVSVETPWDVVPDSTSKFVIYLPLEAMTFYNNTLEDCEWGYLVYGPGYDTVIADNKSINTLGIQAYSNIGENEKLGVLIYWPINYMRIENNYLVGYSWEAASSGIMLFAAVERKEFLYKVHYGCTIKDNYLEGNNRGAQEIIDWRNSQERVVMYGYYNGIALNHTTRTFYMPDSIMLGIIIENNTIKNMDKGITLGGYNYHRDGDPAYFDKAGVEGVVIRNNHFDNVDQEMDIREGSDYVILDDEITVEEK